MKYECVLFDMDGTLLDTLDDITDSCNATMLEMGYPTHTREEVKGYINNGARRLISRAVPEGASNEDIDRCLAFFVEHYRGNVANKTCPYPGIMPLLNGLKSRGVKLAVVSNKFDGAVKSLSAKFFAGLIDVAVGERESEGVRKKPYPDTVFEAVRLLGVDKDACLYTGDSDVDIETAKNAGMDCLAVSWGFRPRESLVRAGAVHIADDPREFIDVMEKM